MMKLTDFRIGNLILMKGAPHEHLKIAEILRNCVNIAPRREAPWQQIPIDYVEGIEITEEILLKYGFEYRKTVKAHFTDHDYIMGDWKVGKESWNQDNKLDESWGIYHDGDLILCTEWLHELQNIYYLKEKEELTEKIFA